MKKMFTFVAAMLLCTVAFAEEKELFNPANASIKETYFAPNWAQETNSRLPTMPPRVLSPSTFRATSLHNGKDK